MQFTDRQIQRYSRHLILPEIGLEGQSKISRASILCVGAGGLASPAIIYLSAAGVGRIGVVDFDSVDISNLQRQIIHTTNNIGMAKTDSAMQAIKAINPDVEVDLYKIRLSASNATEIFKKFDIVLDCSDNFPTRYLVNDVCFDLAKPLVYGSVFQFEGQASVFNSGTETPCYRCLYPEPPPPDAIPSCAEAGVFCIVPGIIGLIQANEAIKLILGIGSLLAGRMLIFNALEMRFREVRLKRDPECILCGKKRTIGTITDYPVECFTNSALTRGLQQSASYGVFDKNNNILTTADEISPVELKKIIDSHSTHVQILDVRENDEITTTPLPGSLHIPLSTLESRLNELNREFYYCVVCQYGIRSKIAVQILKSHGFDNVKSLRGGLIGYAST